MNILFSGGSRISRWGVGGRRAIGGGGTNLRCGNFLAKTYVKMKEFDPVGGARRRRPPGSANAVLMSYVSLNVTQRDPFTSLNSMRTNLEM